MGFLKAIDALLRVLRRIGRAPGFSISVFLLVAIAVFANVTAFAGWYTLHHKSLPFAESERLALPAANLRAFGMRLGLNPQLLEQLRVQPQVFDRAAGWRVERAQRERDTRRDWVIARATDDLLPTLGTVPALGRSYAKDADGELLLAHEAWRTRLGGRQDVLGARLTIGGRSYTVVGVLPAGFGFPERRVDAWTAYVPSAEEIALTQRRGVGALEVLVRLAPGVGLERGREAIASLLATAPELKGLRRNGDMVGELKPLRAAWAGDENRALDGFAAATVLLLFVVAFNLGSMLLERVARRTRELAVRCAIGAGARALFVAACGDMLVLSAAGAAAGMSALPLGGMALVHFGLLPQNLPVQVGHDGATLLAGALATALLLMLACAVGTFAALRRLNYGALAASQGNSGLGRTRTGLLVLQLAFTTLLVGASILVLRSTASLLDEDTGFDREHTLMLNFDVSGDGAESSDSMESRLNVLRNALAVHPGIEAVALANLAPFSRSDAVSSFSWGDGPPQSARMRSVSDGYFRAMGISMVRGRDFAPGDAPRAGSVLVVDEQFVSRYLPDRDPIGATVKMPGSDDKAPVRMATVIGVARTIRQRSLDEPADLPTIYELETNPAKMGWFVLRAKEAPEALVPAVSALVGHHLPVARVSTLLPLRAMVELSVETRRSLGRAGAAFGAITLLLAALGLYAALEFAFQRRERELAVRAALGATPVGIRVLVLRHAASLGLAGIPVGAFIGVALATLHAADLHRVKPADPLSWLAAAGIVAAAVLLACIRPANRAARISPLAALAPE